MKRLLVIGDSWAAGHVAEDATDNGWPLMLGIAPELRQGVDGSTAAEWAQDKNGVLTRALQTPCDAVLVCLGGNDAFAAWADKRITADEIAAISENVKAVMTAVAGKGVPMYVLLYANPYPMDWRAKFAIIGLNAAVALGIPAGATALSSSNVLTTADCWARNDFHPSYAGHQILAAMIAQRTGFAIDDAPTAAATEGVEQ